MEQMSTALIEARLEHMKKRHPNESSQNIWLMVFLEMERLDEVKDYLSFGFNAETPSSSQLINQNMQSQFGSDLYLLFAQHGRNPHMLRDTQTLIYSLYNFLSPTDPNARFSLSDIGMGIHMNMPISWSKLQNLGFLDWNTPCAQYKNLILYPAELALIEANVSLAYRIIDQGGKIQTSEVFSFIVQGFLQNSNSNSIVRHKVWSELLSFDPNVCAKELDIFSRQNNWSNDTRAAAEAELLAPPQMVKKQKSKTTQLSKSPENTVVDKRRQFFVNNLSTLGPWVTLKDVLSSGDICHFDIAERIYEKEKCSLNILDSHNPLTTLIERICSTKNSTGLRFFLNRGLRGDQVVKSATGDTVLHLLLTGQMHQPPTKDFMQTVRALLKATERVSVVNHKGETPLFPLVNTNYYAVHVQPIIEIMVDKGLDLRIRDHKGQTASEFLFAQYRDTILGTFLRNMEITQDKNVLLDVVKQIQEKEAQTHSNKRRM